MHYDIILLSLYGFMMINKQVSFLAFYILMKHIPYPDPGNFTFGYIQSLKTIFYDLRL